MQEQHVSDIINAFIRMLLICGLLCMTFIAFNLHRLSSFKQEVNYTIERQGGLNTDSLKTIAGISKNYNNYFVVTGLRYDKDHNGTIGEHEGEVISSGEHTQVTGVAPQQYGTQFIYRVHVKIPIPFASFMNDGKDNVTPIPKYLTLEGNGTATSKVRTDDDR